MFLRAILLTVVGATCACSRVNVVTDTYSDPTVIPGGFPYNASFAVILPATSPNVLFDKEVRHKIECILCASGFRIARDCEAEYLINFTYGIDLDTKTTLSPVYVPGETVTTEGNSDVCGAKGNEHSEYKETTTSSSVEWVPIEIANNTRWLAIQVSRSGNLIWNGSSKSVGQSGDLRDIMNYLLLSNLQFFGKSTHAQVNQSISSKDETLKWLTQI